MVSTVNELYHHGVKGMKWGVRRYQKKIDRVEEKRDEINKKLKTKKPTTHIGRTTQAHRIGRVNKLNRKAAHRRAKLNYKLNKTKANKEKLRDARSARLTYNVLPRAGNLVGLGVTTATQGRYARYKKKGDDTVEAVLKAYGQQYLHVLVPGVAYGVGVGAVSAMLI